MAEPTPNHILPAYVERGHVQVVFENEPETVEPSTPTATNSEGTNNAPDQSFLFSIHPMFVIYLMKFQ